MIGIFFFPQIDKAAILGHFLPSWDMDDFDNTQGDCMPGLELPLELGNVLIHAGILSAAPACT